MANTSIENTIAAIETSLEAIDLVQADYKSGGAAYKGQGTYVILLGSGDSEYHCANKARITAQLNIQVTLDKKADTVTSYDDVSNWIEKIIEAVLGTEAPTDAIDVGMPCSWDTPEITESKIEFTVSFTAIYLADISFT